MRKLSELFAEHRPIAYRLATMDWFDERVLFVAPEPEAPFRVLTEQVYLRFPDCPPYAGQFEQIIPHMALGVDAPLSEMRVTARAAKAFLPLEGVADEVWLMAGVGLRGRWRKLHTFRLAGGRPEHRRL
jgi:hypothetical protein